MRRDRYAVITREMCREFGIVQRLDVLVPEPMSVYRLLKSTDAVSVSDWFNFESDRAMAFLGPLLPRGMVPFVYSAVLDELPSMDWPTRLFGAVFDFERHAVRTMYRYHTFRPGAATAVLRRRFHGIPELEVAAKRYDRYAAPYRFPVYRGVQSCSYGFRLSVFAWVLREATRPPCGKRLDAMLGAIAKITAGRRGCSTTDSRSAIWRRVELTGDQIVTSAFRNWVAAGKPGLRGPAVQAH